MTAKEVKFGDSARKKLANGVNILANAVKTTLGQKGETLYLINHLEPQQLPKMAYLLQKRLNLKTNLRIWALKWSKKWRHKLQT